MVPQRVFQTIRRLRTVLVLASISALLPAVAEAQDKSAPAPQKSPDHFEVSDAFVIDLRPGADDVRAPSREAFADALAEHGELRLGTDTELGSLLARSPYSAILEQGRLTLASAALAYGSRDCPGTRSRSGQAILDLAAADASGVSARAEIRQAYLFRFLCAHRGGEVDNAMAAARNLRNLAPDAPSGDGRPGEISVATWQQYPVLDAQSNQAQVPVQVKSTPPGATVWVDFEERGTSPIQVFLSAGEHVVAMASEAGAVSQQVTVTGPGTMDLPLHKSEQRWKGMAESVEELRTATAVQRKDAMRNLMAALESQIAFVMREPGRISVWILPLGRGAAEHVGHAPNASIAGSLAIRGLRDSERSPGLDPNFPLLVENESTTTLASSNRGWWIFGVVLGAAAVGAGLIVAQDVSEDRQRIEVSLP